MRKFCFLMLILLSMSASADQKYAWDDFIPSTQKTKFKDVSKESKRSLLISEAFNDEKETLVGVGDDDYVFLFKDVNTHDRTAWAKFINRDNKRSYSMSMSLIEFDCANGLYLKPLREIIYSLDGKLMSDDSLDKNFELAIPNSLGYRVSSAYCAIERLQEKAGTTGLKGA